MFSIILLFALASFAGIALSSRDAVYEKASFGDILVAEFDRLIVMKANKTLGTSYTPPTAEQIAASVLDINHTTMITSGLYNTTGVADFNNRSCSFFLTEFGINFSAGFVVPTTSIVVLGNYVKVPFYSGLQTSILVSFDSDRLYQGVTGKWYSYQLGDVVLCLNDTILGGRHAGEVCKANYALTYIDWYNARTNGSSITSMHVRKRFIVQSPIASANIINGQGFTDSLSHLEMFDESGARGFFLESIKFFKDDVTGVYYTKTRAVASWPYEA